MPNTWLKDEKNCFEVKNNNLWHEPILNPQRLLYNSSGNFSPRSGSFGYVRKIFKDGKLVKKAHAGIDIFAPIGETVYACMNGEVVSAKLRGSLTSGYGNTIIIKVDKNELDICKNNYQLEFSEDGEKEKGTSFGDSNNRYFLYAHLKTMTVKTGDKVNSGDVIGFSGKSGNASNINSASNRHLHFEILDKHDTSNYYQMKNRANAAFYVNFKEANKEKQKNNTDY